MTRITLILLIGSCNFSALLAVPLLPLGDLAIIKTTLPVFGLILDKIVWKRKVNLLRVLFVALIILGVILVIQPPMIFKSKQEQTEYPYYFLGVLLGMIYASTGAAVNAVNEHMFSKNQLTRSQLQLYNGVGTALCAMAYSPFEEVGIATKYKCLMPH